MNTHPDAITNAYIQAVLPEIEVKIHQKALKKVAVITRCMDAKEEAAYLGSPAFERVLNQVRKSDKVYSALQHGQLILSSHQAELERLSKLIEAELNHDHPVNLAFLRSVFSSRVPLWKARKAFLIIEQKSIQEYLTTHENEIISSVQKDFRRALIENRFATIASIHQNEHGSAINAVWDSLFQHRLSHFTVNSILAPASLEKICLNEIAKPFPDVLACGSVRFDQKNTILKLAKKQIYASENRILGALQKEFSRQIVCSLLKQNKHIQALQKRWDADADKKRNLHSALLKAVPAHYRDLYPLARAMHRRFVLHLGPTNSGKTYESVQRLHGAQHGIYLGPLRLLAFEKFEELNLDDIPCSLITGEEQIMVPNYRIQSSTVEMADLKQLYDVAVIDECQMIADHDRGGAWTAAILGLCASEIHLCASPDAEKILCDIITECHDEFSIMRHERMTPLQVEPNGFQFPSGVREGDALIVFSKARVHAVAAELKAAGWKVSLIYGALPPDVRRDQAEKFRHGETSIVVSTDAIAMGMNLPIERVVFLEAEKYDGDQFRTLLDSEIRQIAGRAGRYGQYDIGFVNALGFKQLIVHALSTPPRPVTEAAIGFPESLLGLPLPLSETINQWISMQDHTYFAKASSSRMMSLTSMMETKHTDKVLLYRFVCIPFDETDPVMLEQWKEMYHYEASGKHIDVMGCLPEQIDPDVCSIHQLTNLEEDYRLCDLYYNYTRVFLPEHTDILDEIQRRKDLISQGIIHILSTQKLPQRKCRICKHTLPWNWPYSMCSHCYAYR